MEIMHSVTLHELDQLKKQYQTVKLGDGKTIGTNRIADFYMAHPQQDRFDMRVIQKQIESFYAVKFFNPLYDNPTEASAFARENGHYKGINPVDIVEPDLEAIAMCDKTFVSLSGSSSIGTIQEMVYAKLLGKQVHTYVNPSRKLDEHPWVIYHTDRMYRSINEFVSMVSGEYGVK